MLLTGGCLFYLRMMFRAEMLRMGDGALVPLYIQKTGAGSANLIEGVCSPSSLVLVIARYDNIILVCNGAYPAV